MAASNGERKIALLLDEADIMYRTEYIYPDLKSSKGNPLRFDFAVYEDYQAYESDNVKFLIEFDGEQHFKRKFQTAQAFSRQQSNDKKKNNYCRVKGIVLVRIPFTDYHSMTLDSILESGHFFD